MEFEKRRKQLEKNVTDTFMYFYVTIPDCLSNNGRTTGRSDRRTDGQNVSSLREEARPWITSQFHFSWICPFCDVYSALNRVMGNRRTCTTVKNKQESGSKHSFAHSHAFAHSFAHLFAHLLISHCSLCSSVCLLAHTLPCL